MGGRGGGEGAGGGGGRREEGTFGWCWVLRSFEGSLAVARKRGQQHGRRHCNWQVLGCRLGDIGRRHSRCSLGVSRGCVDVWERVVAGAVVRRFRTATQSQVQQGYRAKIERKIRA